MEHVAYFKRSVHQKVLMIEHHVTHEIIPVTKVKQRISLRGTGRFVYRLQFPIIAMFGKLLDNKNMLRGKNFLKMLRQLPIIKLNPSSAKSFTKTSFFVISFLIFYNGRHNAEFRILF
jgi:hypothetical protein